jgi:hypothetical protein
MSADRATDEGVHVSVDHSGLVGSLRREWQESSPPLTHFKCAVRGARAEIENGIIITFRSHPLHWDRYFAQPEMCTDRTELP